MPDILAKFPDAKRNGAGWAAHCPAHDDRKASLNIARGDKQPWVLNCKAGCTPEAVLRAVGLTLADSCAEQTVTKSQIVATYPYHDEGGAHLFDVVRKDPKDFRQRAASGEWSMKGVRRVPYHLPNLQGKSVVYIVEGEKDADRLQSLGLTATTNPGGAGKWRDDYTKQLAAAAVEHVAILPDNDNAGAAHAAQVAASCHAAGLKVKIVALPDLPPKGDVSDWLDAGHTRDELVALVKAAPLYTLTTTTVDAPADADEADQERRVGEALDRERARREANRRLDAEERGPIQLPKFQTLRERLAAPRPIDRPRYRIERFQPCDSRVILAAQYKTGKTTLVENTVRSLVDGEPFLGREAVTPITGTLALLDFEMGEQQLEDWLREQRIRRDDRVILVSMRGLASSFNILDAKVRAGWAAQFRTNQCAYVVVDCLRPIFDALALDENHDGGRFLEAFDALLVEAGITEALLVHHMGHNGERARGDSRLRDWPDAEWRLVRESDEPASPRFLTAYGRDVDVPECQVEYDVEARRLRLATGSRRDVATDEALAAIVSMLREHKAPLSGRAIKTALAETDHTRKAIEDAIKVGVSTGGLSVADGPHNARLYTVGAGSVPVSRSVPSVSRNSSVPCPAPLKGGTLGHSNEDAEIPDNVGTEGGNDAGLI